MEVIGITSTVGNSKRTVNGIKNYHATPNMTGNMANELNMLFNCDAVEYVNVAKLLLFVKEAAGVCKYLKKTNIGKKVTGFVSEKCNKIAENKTVKNSVNWIKDKYSKITENSVVKKCCGAVKGVFGTEAKNV